MRDGKETEGEAFLGTENKSEIKKKEICLFPTMKKKRSSEQRRKKGWLPNLFNLDQNLT